MQIELEDLGKEMAKPHDAIVIEYLGDGMMNLAIQGLSRVESVILLSTALGSLSDMLDPDEEEELESWLEED